MKYENVKVGPGLVNYDLSGEEWREYEFGARGARVTYRINNPISLVIGVTTHRVVDDQGIIHCVPVVGRFGCVLRWKVRAGSESVLF